MLAVAGVLSLLAAAAIVGGVIPAGMLPGGDTTVFSLPSRPCLQPGLLAIHDREVSLPSGVILRYPSSFYRDNYRTGYREAVFGGRVDTGIVVGRWMDTAIERNPDIALNGYALYLGDRFIALYVRNGSGITTLQDLSGMSIAADRERSGALLTHVLDEAGAENVTIRDADAPLPELAAGNVAAAMGVDGFHTLDAAPTDLRILSYPVRYLEDRHDARFTTALWFSDGEAHLNNSVRTARVYDTALGIGFGNVSRIVRRSPAPESWGVLLEACSNTSIVRLRPGDIALAQELLDTAAEQGYAERRVNLTRLLAGNRTPSG